MQFFMSGRVALARPMRATRMFQAMALFVQSRRQKIKSNLAAAAAAVLLMAGAVVAWVCYGEWRLGRIELTTEGAPVVCTVLAESSDTAFGEPFDLVTRAVVSLPAGDYRLLVNGMGRLGRTYRFAVNRGETQGHTISIDEGRLLGGERGPEIGGWNRQKDVPIPFAPMTVALELSSGHADLIEWSAGSLIRRDGASAKVLWSAFQPARPFDRGRDPAPWLNTFADSSHFARLVQPAPDLNGDGTGDLLWFFGNSPSFLALSGKDGSMLWNYVAEPGGPGGPEPEGPVLDFRDKPTVRRGRSLGAPAIDDVDHDGTPDLIATIEFMESTDENERRAAGLSSGGVTRTQPRFHRRSLLAVSGRTGRWLWSYPIDTAFSLVPQTFWPRSTELVRGRRSALVDASNGSQWLGLDPATGRPHAGPIDLGFTPIRPVQYADLDGDGAPEVLALGLGPATGRHALHAFSITTGRELWTEAVDAPYDPSQGEGPPPDFPLPVDLDDDGRSEIVVPDSGPMPPLSGYRGVKLLDGLTGNTRWYRPMRRDTKDGGLAAIAVAPDLDGDGTRDLIAASLVEVNNPPATSRRPPTEPDRVYVDALSGKDGRRLWWWSVDLPVQRLSRIWKPMWWGRGPDGWPLLAFPIGGANQENIESGLPSTSSHPPTVHLLEASTGQERHALTGLSRASLADLNGDGLDDLWGEVDGELRAFRGEAPEAWRALGTFDVAGSTFGRIDARGVVDFDGDGIADTLIGLVRAPVAWEEDPTGSHTALARSGRDGHVIWKIVLDPRESWFDANGGVCYGLSASGSPVSDMNGDGTPDVIVQKYVPQAQANTIKQTATLPVQLLSGRTGRVLWKAGPLPLGFEAQGYAQIDSIETRVVEPGGAPDLLVRHGSPFVKPGSPPPPAGHAGRPCLTRISGRDGRILWNVALADGMTYGSVNDYQASQYVDLNGDCGLDSLVVVPQMKSAGQPEWNLLAISLRDGKRLWSQSLRFELYSLHGIRVGDLNADKRPDVVVMEEINKGATLDLEVRAFDGRNGKSLWTWSGGAQFPRNRPPPLCAVAALDGDGTRKVCLSYTELSGKRRIVILDGNGKERAHRDVSGDQASMLKAADLNGDGRDELLVWYGDRLHACGPDLKDLWSRPHRNISVTQILSSSPGRAAEIIIPEVWALDGSTGLPRWTGLPPLFYRPEQFSPKLLDPGVSDRLPLLIANGLGATVCRVALPTNAEGKIAPPRGRLARPRDIPDDPRWTRSLPWLAWLEGVAGPWGFLAAAALALVNVVIPLSFLRLVAGRRRYSIRALTALPVAAAIPLMCFLLLEPLLPVGSTPLLASEKRLFLAGTLAGLPLVYSTLRVASSVARRRPKPALALAGLTIVASLAIASTWLWFDMKSMAAIEHFGWRGWYLVALPGAYAASILSIVALVLRKTYRFAKRSREVTESNTVLISA
jgi:outer membrane protein assembly factor BamB